MREVNEGRDRTVIAAEPTTAERRWGAVTCNG